MNDLSQLICQITGAQSLEFGERIQTLWSGYGVIQRAALKGVQPEAVVVKHVDISKVRSNRRGWGGDVSHQRKVRSYQVEKEFYESYANQCNDACRVPKLVVAHEKEDHGGWLIILEDLDAAGFDQRKQSVSKNDIHSCLAWLANFHATFMNCDGHGLWPIGTYWHLATRQEELIAMSPSPLKQAASQIDDRLNQSKYQTLVHGDAKLANFCFGKRGATQKGVGNVSAVDFQYVGRGCGMKDVAYFISSCLDDEQTGAQQDSLLNYYFATLQESFSSRQIAIDFDDLESQWRELYPFAWADFCRFLSGWSPGHWKLNQYNDRITNSVLKSLGY